MHADDPIKRAYIAQLEARAKPGGGDARHSGREFRAMLRACRDLPARQLDENAFATVWVWSDLHLGHDNIIGYANRPFVDAAQMDAVLYRNWDATVGDDDLLLFVGDMAMRKAVAEHTWAHIREAPGRAKHLVVGNHDLTGSGVLRVDGFDDVCSTLNVDGEPPLAFTHMPLADVPPGVVNVHGHTHDEAPRRSRHINVSVEQLDYRPVVLQRIRTLARELAAGRYPDGKTTLRRIENVETASDEAVVSSGAVRTAVPGSDTGSA